MQDLLWRQADTLIWLDYPLPLILGRLLRRTLRRVITRQELWNGNRENFCAFIGGDSILLWALKSYPKHRRVYPARLRAPEYAHLHVLHFHTPRETQTWLAALPEQIQGLAGR